MAITKILHIGEGKQQRGRHLRSALNYITVPAKTGDGRYVTGVGCQPEYAYEQMCETKELFAKTDKRQAYHIIISFEEGEITADKAFEFIGRFVEDYLKGEYETVYAVHDNTDHIHGHIIFNSVNRMTGHKYRYEKGDWAKYMQPVTNRLCEEYGLSTIRIEEAGREKGITYREWRDGKGADNTWSDMIRRDVDGAILRATDEEDFYRILAEKGYEIKEGKYVSIRPQGMSRFRRLRTLGENYTEEAIRERIASETLESYQRRTKTMRILRVKIPYHMKRTKLSGLQRKYFRRLYKTGRLKKRPYSQAWKYREDIRRFHILQAQYLFLAEYGVHGKAELEKAIEKLSEIKKEYGREKSALYKKKAKLEPLDRIVKRMSELEAAEISYQKGDHFFEEEHAEYVSLGRKLKDAGFIREEVAMLTERYRDEGRLLNEKYGKVARDIKTATGLLAEYEEAQPRKEQEPVKQKEHEKKR